MRDLNWSHRLRNKTRIDSGNTVKIGAHVKMSQCRIFVRGNNNQLTIGTGSVLRAVSIEIIGDNCTLAIGKDCMIGHYCYLSVKEQGKRLIIGNDCCLSRNVKVMASDGHPIFSDGVCINPARDIVIGDHVWIGDQVTVLKGVTVGDGSVIGIGSIVTKSVPASVIAAGNPARVVRQGITWQP